MCSARQIERVRDRCHRRGARQGFRVGYHLARQGRPFVILDANERIGDSWRKRWDSLRLFTPARFDGLAGMPFPASPKRQFPTKNQMGDYLEAYATQRFKLPVRKWRCEWTASRGFSGGTYVANGGRPNASRRSTSSWRWPNYQEPWVPPFAQDLDPRHRAIAFVRLPQPHATAGRCRADRGCR